MADLQPVAENPTAEEWDKFWAQVQGLNKGDCEEWIGTLFSHGYGAFWYRGQDRRAHRVAYVWQYGEPGNILDHHCENKRCVRAHPEHVWPSTPRDNILRGVSPPAINARKVRPGCGHSEKFTYDDPRGWRGCTRCRDEASKRHKNAHRDEINAKRRESRKRIVYEERPCQHCGTIYQPQRSDSRYCYERDCINSRQRENRNKRLVR